MVNNVAIVTVRNSSSRLPNKPFMKIKDDLRSIDIIITRAKKTGLPVILATSSHRDDGIFDKVAEEHGVEIFKGSLLNKIKRWYDCFNIHNIDNALLIDGDDLSYDYNIGLRALKKLQSSNFDIIMGPEEIVCGFFTYAITTSGMSKLYETAPNDSTDTDVITEYIKKANLKILFVELNDYEKNQKARLTLDYNEDLEFFRKLYQNLEIETDGKTIIKYLKKNESVSRINYHRQKDFLENQARFNERVK